MTELLTVAYERLDAMDIESALRAFHTAEQAGFDADACCGARWVCHMLTGDFDSAWRESDRIAARGNPDRHRFWDGTPSSGKRVLIRCLHGLGDTLQFIRYVPYLRNNATYVIIEAQPRLKRLLAQCSLADEVITWGEPEGAWDQQIEVMELPRIFRTTLETIPNCVPYLKAPEHHSLRRAEADHCLRVGFVWASSQYNPARSLPLSLVGQLFGIPGARFYSLQAGTEREDLKHLSFPITDLHDPSTCVLDTAKQLNGLDLVITADTMMAHLAGGMGVPVWTLLPFQCDWRWMLARDDSPWYPTMRLFRQTSPGDWATVIDQVADSLRSLCNRRQGASSGLLEPVASLGSAER